MEVDKLSIVMLTHKQIRGWSGAGGSITKTLSVSDGAELNIDTSILKDLSKTPNTNNTPVSIDVHVDAIKSLYLVSDQSCVILVNTIGGKEIDLTANSPFTWMVGDTALKAKDGSQITGDITELLVTPDSSLTDGTSMLFQIRLLYNPASTT